MGPSSLVNHQVGGDPAEPGEERFPLKPVLWKGMDSLDEGLCGDIFGISGASTTKESMAEDATVVAPVELCKGSGISGKGSLDQYAVRKLIIASSHCVSGYHTVLGL